MSCRQAGRWQGQQSLQGGQLALHPLQKGQWHACLACSKASGSPLAGGSASSGGHNTHLPNHRLSVLVRAAAAAIIVPSSPTPTTSAPAATSPAPAHSATLAAAGAELRRCLPALLDGGHQTAVQGAYTWPADVGYNARRPGYGAPGAGWLFDAGEQAV